MLFILFPRLLQHIVLINTDAISATERRREAISQQPATLSELIVRTYRNRKPISTAKPISHTVLSRRTLRNHHQHTNGGKLALRRRQKEVVQIARIVECIHCVHILKNARDTN